MKNTTIITAALLLLFITDSKAQLTGITRAPLQLGNIWVYDVGNYGAMRRATVSDTNTVIDSINYFKIISQSLSGSSGNHYARLRADGFYALRMDSTYTEPNHELPYYKKDAVIGDTWTVQTYFTYSIEDTFTTNVFGEQTTVKYLKMDGGVVLRHEYWTEKFGLLSNSSFGGNILELLQGCVIDGVVYGDTSFTLVGVEDEFNSPNDFTLEQNYPNPFNPSTSLQYTVGSRQYVTLKVYDILGNEIATLVSEEKPAGKYEVAFNGNKIVSGIYIYQLSTGKDVISRKMTLLK